MARRFGFAADHVRRFTLVTADGEIRDVTPESDPDLFWAVRGGKSTFGIVTDLEFGLMPVARFYGGCVVFPAEATAAVLHAWREWAPTLSDDTTTSVAMLRLPPDPALPEPLRGRFVTMLRFAPPRFGGRRRGGARADARAGHPADGPRRRDALRGRRRRAHGPHRAHARPRVRRHGRRAAGRRRRRPAGRRRAGRARRRWRWWRSGCSAARSPGARRCPTPSPAGTRRSTSSSIGAPFGPPIEATAAATAASPRRAPAVGVRRPAELRRPRSRPSRSGGCGTRRTAPGCWQIRDRVDPTGLFATNIHLGWPE